MIVYPPNKHKTESETIFFIGFAKESCVINGEAVELVHAGNFCPVFDLKQGENLFKVEIDGEVFDWSVSRHSERSEESSGPALVQTNALGSSLSLRMTKKICLDPGHGGSAHGTCSPKGILEKDLNLSLALKLKEELIKQGYEVILTREEDKDLGLQERVDTCKEFGSDLFISVHHNAIPDHQNPIEHHGLSCHYYYQENKALAEKLSVELASKLNLRNNGAIEQDLHVLRENTFCPALLIEFGYLIHPQESELIVTESFQELASSAFAGLL